MGKKTPVCKVNGHVWIESDGERYLDETRVKLLERVKEHGSISAAARSLKIAYRQAWFLVDSMNKHAKDTLVVTQIGGKSGGGSYLTEEGEKAIYTYWEVHRRYNNFISEETGKIKKM